MVLLYGADFRRGKRARAARGTAQSRCGTPRPNSSGPGTLRQALGKSLSQNLICRMRSFRREDEIGLKACLPIGGAPETSGEVVDKSANF